MSDQKRSGLHLWADGNTSIALFGLDACALVIELSRRFEESLAEIDEQSISAIAMRKLEVDAPGDTDRFRVYCMARAPFNGRTAASMDTETLLLIREFIARTALKRTGAHYKAWSS